MIDFLQAAPNISLQENIRQWSLTISAAGGAMIMIGGIYTFFHRRVFRPAIHKIEAAVDIIERQMTPNGGSTLVDLVNKIPVVIDDIQKVKEEVSSIKDVVESRSKALERIEKDLTEVKYSVGKVEFATTGRKEEMDERTA